MKKRKGKGKKIKKRGGSSKQRKDEGTTECSGIF
jgi:hypothetical protein